MKKETDVTVKMLREAAEVVEKAQYQKRAKHAQRWWERKKKKLFKAANKGKRAAIFYVRNKYSPAIRGCLIGKNINVCPYKGTFYTRLTVTW